MLATHLNKYKILTVCIRDQWFWRPAVLHKILEGRWQSIKNRFMKLSGCLHFGLLAHRKYTLTLLWDENFFCIGRVGIKNPSFYIDFKNVQVQKCKEPLNISKNNFFYKHVLDFHRPFKILFNTSKLWNFVNITGPLCAYTAGVRKCWQEYKCRWKQTFFVISCDANIFI